MLDFFIIIFNFHRGLLRESLFPTVVITISRLVINDVTTIYRLVVVVVTRYLIAEDVEGILDLRKNLPLKIPQNPWADYIREKMDRFWRIRFHFFRFEKKQNNLAILCNCME